MDIRFLCSLIDEYSLSECVAALRFGAPALFAEIEQDVLLRPDDPNTLAKARAALRKALLEECHTN